MENIEVKISNDGKEKWQSWELNIFIRNEIFSNDDHKSYLGGGHHLFSSTDISMYDCNYNSLKENSLKELKRLRDSGYISDNIIKKVIKEFNNFEKEGV